MIKCVQCKDGYTPDYNLVKIGEFWAEIYNIDNKTNYNFCEWCLFSLNQEVINDSL